MAAMMRAAMPPMTPPAMAPVLDEELSESGEVLDEDGGAEIELDADEVVAPATNGRLISLTRRKILWLYQWGWYSL